MLPGELPPPPYTEQEFDQKISQALVASAQQTPPEDQGEWQEWSDAAFAAAEERSNDTQTVDSSRPRAGSSTQSYASSQQEAYELANTEPLKIHKRGKSTVTSAPMKPRPSWMDEAERGPSNADHQSPAESQPLSSWNAAQTRHEVPPDDGEEDNSVPPPPFGAIDPPVEARLEYHAESTPPSPLISPVPDHLPSAQPDHPPQLRPRYLEARLEYHSESTPPSPLTSPVPDHFSSVQPDHLPQLHLNLEEYPEPSNGRYSDVLPRPSRLPRQSLPAPPRAANYHLDHRPVSMLSHQTRKPGGPRIDPNLYRGPSLSPDPLRQRPISMLPPPPVQSSSRLQFNASTAFNEFGGQSLASQHIQSFNPSALYNSAVSAHLTTTSMLPRESHSARQHQPMNVPYAQPTPRRGQDLRLGDHTTSTLNPSTCTSPTSSADWQGHTSPSTGYPVNWSMSTVQSSPPQAIIHASHFPQRNPTYLTTVYGPTPHRWATSEQQFNQSFH